MRTLHANLTTAQQDASRTPYIELVFRSRTRLTTRTYKTTDATNRIMYVQQGDGRDGTTQGGGYIAVEGFPFNVSAIIHLRDVDNSLILLDWKGYRVDIGWGFNTSSGDRSSSGPAVFVVSERSITIEGQLILELYCVSLWGLLQARWAADSNVGIIASGKFNWQGDQSVKHILMELMAGLAHPLLSASFTEVDANETGDITNVTTNAINTTASFYPLEASPPGGEAAVDNTFYIGFVRQFDRITVDVTTVGVWVGTLAYEYWNGSAWANLANVTDGTAQWTVGALKVIDFDRPTNWAAKNIHSLGSFYWMRFRVTAFTSLDTRPAVTRVFVDQDFGLSLDSTTSGQGDDYQPDYVVQRSTAIADIISDILQNTLLGIVLQNDYFHIRYVDPALSETTNYTYNSDHSFRTGLLEDSLVVPNKIIVVKDLPEGEGLGTAYSGTATDSTSDTAIGSITTISIEDSVTSDSVAATLADRQMKQLQRDRTQGQLLVPMNVGQEVWDKVTVADTRSGQTWNGRVSHLMRTFRPGLYALEITMGGVDLRSQYSAPRDMVTIPPEVDTPVGASRAYSGVLINQSGMVANANALSGPGGTGPRLEEDPFVARMQVARHWSLQRQLMYQKAQRRQRSEEWMRMREQDRARHLEARQRQVYGASGTSTRTFQYGGIPQSVERTLSQRAQAAEIAEENLLLHESLRGRFPRGSRR